MLNAGTSDVPQDKSRAILLYKRSANSGHIAASTELAKLFRGSAEEYTWLLKAARGGDLEAQQRLRNKDFRQPRDMKPANEL